MQLSVNKQAYFDRMRAIWLEETANGRSQAALDRYHARQKEEWAKAKGLASQALQAPPSAPKAPDPTPEPQPARKKAVVAKLVRKAPAPKAAPVATPSKPLTVGEVHKVLRLAKAKIKGNVRPILGTIRVMGGEGAWTDLETSIIIPGFPFHPSPVCIDMDFFFSLPPKAALSEIQFETVNQDEGHPFPQVVTVLGAFRSTPGLDPEEFPEVPAPSAVCQTVNLTKAGLDAIAFATSTDVNKKILNGICLEPDQIAATDGHRLAYHHAPNGFTCVKRMETHYFDSEGKRCNVLDATERDRETDGRKMKEGCTSKEVAVPGNIVLPSSFARLYAGGAVQVGEAVSVFNRGRFTVMVRHLEGNYPDYRRVVPDGCRLKAVLNRGEFIAMLQEVGKLATDCYMGVTFLFGFGECKATFTNPGVSAYSKAIPCEINRDGLFRISFNVRYLLDAAQSLHLDTVEIEMNESQSPAMIRESSDTACVTHIVMPMMV